MASYRPKGADEIGRNMSAIRSRDNKTEMALRKALHAAGLRYRLHSRGLVGKPDLVFARARVVVFVDGDFWHARKLREQGMQAVKAMIKTKTKPYWLAKFTRRVARDDEVTASLRADGWKVLRFWESDLRRDLGPAVHQIRAAVRGRSVVTRRGRKADR